MAFLMEKILNNAQKLAGRLKEHDGSTDNLVEQMTTLNKKIDSMKTFQENLPDLNEMALRKPRCAIKLGLSQENSQIRELEQENTELKRSLEEHELALELIMSKYRQEVAKLLKSNQVDQSSLHKETAESQDLQDKAEKIYTMGNVMWKAIGEDDRSVYENQELLSQLRLENKGMRELLAISCSHGNPLRVMNRQTQTDRLALHLSSNHDTPRVGPSGVGDVWLGDGKTKSRVIGAAELEANILEGSRVGGGDLSGMNKFSLNLEDPPASLEGSRKSDPGLPSTNPGHCQRSRLSSPNGRDRSPISKLKSEPALPLQRATEERSKLVPHDLGTKLALPDVVASSGGPTDSTVKEENRTIDLQACQSSGDDSVGTAVANHAVDDQILSDVQEPEAAAASQVDNMQPSSATNHHVSLANDVTVAVASSPNHPVAGGSHKHQAPMQPKGSVGYRNISTTPSGMPRHQPGIAQKKTGSPTPGAASRVKSGASVPNSLHSKTPPNKSVASRDSSSSVASSTVAGKQSSASPSLPHAGKSSPAAHASRVAPVRIKTSPKHPSLFSVGGSAPSTTVSLSSTSASAAVLLDSNGNNSSGISSELSNMNSMVDGQ